MLRSRSESVVAPSRARELKFFYCGRGQNDMAVAPSRARELKWSRASSALPRAGVAPSRARELKLLVLLGEVDPPACRALTGA